jgi:hypothetical protein
MDSNKPGFEDTSLGQALHVCDLVFLGFFTVEALLKVLAAGLILGPHTYLRNGRFTIRSVYCSQHWQLQYRWSAITLVDCSWDTGDVHAPSGGSNTTGYMPASLQEAGMVPLSWQTVGFY